MAERKKFYYEIRGYVDNLNDLEELKRVVTDELGGYSTVEKAVLKIDLPTEMDLKN